MKRSKVSYGYIHNHTARKSSFKKRKSGILKKVQELSILCGVQACCVVYSPNCQEPEFWPSELEVSQMLHHYESISDADKTGKKIDEESYMKENVRKLEEQVKQLEFSNQDMENNHYLHQIYRSGKSFEEFQRNDLVALKGYVAEKRQAFRRRIQFIHQGSGGVVDPNSIVDETLIGDIEDPSMEEWYIKMTSEKQYEVGISSSVRGGSSSNVRGLTSGSNGFNMSLYNWNNITISSIEGNGGAGHGWLLHHGPSEGQHHGQVGGTVQFPGTNNYVSSMPFYDNVRGNAGGNVTEQPEDHHK